MQLRPYQAANEKELLAFVRSHHWATDWPESLLIRFLRELSSSTHLVFDLFEGGRRAAVAVLVDKVENPANDANFEMLAIHPGINPENAFSFIIPVAKARLPANRSGLAVGFPADFLPQADIVQGQGFLKNYEMYDMLNSKPASRARSHPSEFILTRNDDDGAVYTALKLAFARNPDTSIPGFEDWQAGRRRNMAQRTWVKKEDDLVVAFLNLYPAGEFIEIGTVGVLPQYRGRGYARRLIEHALEYVATAGFPKCKLSVAVQNERALGLYQALGFEPISRHMVYRWPRA